MKQLLLDFEGGLGMVGCFRKYALALSLLAQVISLLHMKLAQNSWMFEGLRFVVEGFDDPPSIRILPKATNNRVFWPESLKI